MIDSEAADLIEAYFTGELDAQGRHRLFAWLREDPERYRLLVNHSHLEIALNQVYQARRIQQAFGAFPLTQLLRDAEAHTPPPVDITEAIERRRQLQAAAQHQRDAGSRTDPPRRPGPRVIVIPKFLVYGLAAAVLLLAATLILSLGGPDGHTAGEQPPPQLSSVTPAPQAGPAPQPMLVATVTDQIGLESGRKLTGMKLKVGDSLALHTGMAKLRTPQGAMLLVESPARIVAIAESRVRIEQGAVVARCEPEGSQITIDAGGVQVTDLGTEFAVERIGPDGLSIHVFDGQVVAKRVADGGGGEHQEVVLEGGSAVRYDSAADTFEATPIRLGRFTRDFDSHEYTQPRHVMAYWRFEQGTPGTHCRAAVPQAEGDQEWVYAVRDVSGHGNHLYTGSEQLAPRHSDAVPERMVPGTGELNVGVLADTDNASHGVRNLFSRAPYSRPILPLYNKQFKQWTVEFSVRFAALRGLQSAVSFTTDHYQRPRIRLGADGDRLYAGTEDRAGHWRELRSPAGTLDTQRWCHVAVIHDGQTMRILVCEQGERAYREVGRMPVDGTYYAQPMLPTGMHEWTIGGEARSHDMSGFIDEVRVSDRALEPDQLLFAQPGPNLAAERSSRP